MKTQLSVAREEHERIQTRYENVQNDLQCIKSELNASYRHISMLEQQTEALEVEDEAISAIIHPIRRCPGDILRYIFELSVRGQPDHWTPTAFTISHVCRTWRRLALKTGLLWSHIAFPIDGDLELAREYIAAMRPRLWRTHTEVRIDNIGSIPGGNPDDLDAILSLDLDSLKGLKHLELILRGGRQSLSLVLPIINQITFPIEHISIGFHMSLDGNEWDLDDLLSSGMKHLKLRGWGASGHNFRICVSDTRRFSTLESLSLSEIRFPTLVQILPRFPNLKMLHLEHVILSTVTIPNEIKQSGLSSLAISSTSKFPWHQFFAPGLKRLKVHIMKEEEDSVVEFICRHRTLKHLDTNISEELLGRIASSLSELERLEIEGTFIFTLFQSQKERDHPLNRLTHLTTRLVDDDCSLEMFEAIVMDHYIAPKKPGALLNQPIPYMVWDIEDCLSSANKTWRCSKFMDHFDLTIISDDDNDW